MAQPTPSTAAPSLDQRARLQLKRFVDGGAEALLPVAAVALALVIGAGMLLALGADPLAAYRSLVEGAVGSVSGITQTLVKATPLLLVGLGIVIAFRGGVINIGGEGQLLVGALLATAIALYLPLPGWLLRNHRRDRKAAALTIPRSSTGMTEP